ncbi:MAG: mechanosensitive ion channel family protein [Candidatus Krumholzibacteriia bacterium]
MSTFLSHEIGPWTVSHFAGALIVLLAAVIARIIIIHILGRRLRVWAARTETQADDLAIDAMLGPLGWLIILIGAHFAWRLLGSRYAGMLDPGLKAFALFSTLIAAWCAFRLVDVGFVMMAERAARNDSRFDDQLVPMLRKACKIFVGVIAALVAVQNLGFSVSGLLAGLGIGGLAFALAAKDTIANVFGSITIFIDRPFRVGDWVTLPDADGTVEEVGLRTTRIRTFEKTVVIIPNQTLTNATMENHSLMPRRRVRMTLSVTYDTTPAQMRDLLARLEALLRAHPGVAPENLQVRFLSFGESSLEVLVNYFTLTVDYDAHSAIRQELNLAIMDLLERLGVAFAFPTRTLQMAGGPARDEAGLPPGGSASGA